jgi:hypothetical protein
MALSPDGRWALSAPTLPAEHLVLLPTGVGQALRLDGGGPTFPTSEIVWTPDSAALVAEATRGTEPAQLYLLFVSTGQVRAITDAPDGIGYPVGVSPGGRFALAGDWRQWLLIPLAGGTPLLLSSGAGTSETRGSTRGWTEFIQSSGPPPLRIERLDVASGRQTPCANSGLTMSPD